MNNTKHFYIIFFLILFAFFLCFVSCSDSEPKIDNVASLVVFNYETAESFPKTRLSVFAETSSDAHRVEKIKIFNKNSTYEWTATEPVLIADKDRQWAGYTNFVVPSVSMAKTDGGFESQNIPTGYYEFTYTDAQENETVSTFSIYYPEKLLSSKASEVYDILEKSYTEQIAIFDKNDIMLYFGMRQDAWNNDENIFSAFGNSAYYRVCLISRNSSAICLLPKVGKMDEKAESIVASE